MARTDRPSPGDEPVDFVVGVPDDGPDEELQAPEDDQRARTRRLRGQIALGGAGLVVALLIGRGSLTSDGAPRQHHSPSPSSVPTAPAPTGPVTPPPYLYKNNLPPRATTTGGG